MKKKAEEQKKGAPAYMNTYGDMMTLLLTFFVLLFSMSTVDAEKFKALLSGFSGGAGVLEGSDSPDENTNMLGNGVSNYPVIVSEVTSQRAVERENELEKVKQELQAYVSSNQLESKVSVEKNGDEITIRFADMLLFDSGKAAIKPGAVPVLGTIGDKLKSYIADGYNLRCEGHTDNVPINTVQFPTNWELSSARAIAVARFFVEEMDFPKAQVSGEGQGEYRPIASNDTAEGRSKNRRVEIILTKGSSESSN